jgi:hypothetical protein
VTIALRHGEAQLVEKGRWGPYNGVVTWTRADGTRQSFLVELEQPG